MNMKEFRSNRMLAIIAVMVVAVVVAMAAVLMILNPSGSKKVSEAHEQSGQRQASAESQEKDVRLAVWEQLSDRQKEEIVGSWEDGRAEKMILGGDPAAGKADTVDDNYRGREVYFVEFTSKMEPLLGNVSVYADVDTLEIIGYGLRD